jgi:hypothetical protein
LTPPLLLLLLLLSVSLSDDAPGVAEARLLEGFSSGAIGNGSAAGFADALAELVGSGLDGLDTAPGVRSPLASERTGEAGLGAVLLLPGLSSPAAVAAFAGASSDARAVGTSAAAAAGGFVFDDGAGGAPGAISSSSSSISIDSSNFFFAAAVLFEAALGLTAASSSSSTSNSSSS